MTSTTSRRTVLKSFVTGGVLASSGVAHASAQHGQVKLPPDLAHATVVFGQWNTPMDRFTGVFGPPNVGHHVSPHEVTIAAGGSVAFLIGGFHLVLVYNDGVKHSDIDITKLIITVPPAPAAPPLINDETNRLYRGLDPRISGVDRIEVVHFHNPGTYLMACGVLPHFREMFGYIKVVGTLA
jgi:hypothetical protein